MKWKSCAEWDRSVYTDANNESISKDTHATPRAAEAVCSMLERDGFGGDGKDFPIRTWTEMEKEMEEMEE